jgi:hypothetical protein
MKPCNFQEAIQQYRDTASILGVPREVVEAEVAKSRDYKRRFKAEALKVYGRRGRS